MKGKEEPQTTLGHFEQRPMPRDKSAKASQPSGGDIIHPPLQKLGASSWMQIQGPSLTSLDSSLCL